MWERSWQKFLVWLVASASDPNTQQPSDPNTQQPASQPATWQANKAAAAESRMITCVWSLLVPDLVMLVVVVVIIIVTSIFVNCHQSDIWLAVSVTVALWHSCCCCCCCCCCGIYNDSFLSFVGRLLLYVLCFPPPSFAGCCHLCRRRLESLYLPLLLTYPCQQPASFENFNCEQLTIFFSIITLPFGDSCSRWLAGWLVK